MTVAALMACFVFLWTASGGCFLRRQVPVDVTEFIMDTAVTVKIYYQDRARGEELLKEAFQEAKRIEHMMEAVKGDGEIRQLNLRTSPGTFTLSPELATVFREAKRYYELSNAAFDPTIAAVKWLWDFTGEGRKPTDDELRKALKTVGFDKVEISGDSIHFSDVTTKIDLGGIAKGYTVDAMIEYLKSKGVNSILVNAGGDIMIVGKKPAATFFGEPKDWVIGVRHPRLNRTMTLPWNPYPAVATSGDYQRFFVQDGVRYHHIIDPATGYPATGCASVTVWTTSAMLADLLATTIFVLGPEKGVAFAESLDSVETLIFYERDGKIETALSSGIKGRIGL